MGTSISALTRSASKEPVLGTAQWPPSILNHIIYIIQYYILTNPTAEAAKHKGLAITMVESFGCHMPTTPQLSWLPFPKQRPFLLMPSQLCS